MNPDVDKKESSARSGEGLFARLLESRTIVLSSAIDANITRNLIQQLVIFNHQSSKKPITLISNSPGGDVFSGLALYDMLRFISAPVISIITGLAASMGSIIPLAADKGQRYTLPNAKFLIHQPLMTGYQGRASELEIQANEILRDKERIISIYAQHTGKKPEKIAHDIDQDHWMDAKQAKAYGLVDQIISSEKELKASAKLVSSVKK